MKKNEILLSQGSILWLGLKKSIQYTEDIGFDGLEILPTRIVIKEINDLINRYGKKWHSNLYKLYKIKSIHQNWRLDNGLDNDYGISLMPSLLSFIIRFIFFPKANTSRRFVGNISKLLNIPVVIHSTNDEWTRDNYGKEFSGGILYEIFNTKKVTKEILKNWLTKNKYNVVIDTRDDQSLSWAKNHGFANYKDFWNWIGLKKIKSLQLTLIGMEGIRKILLHQNSLAEKQLLWLHRQSWHGSLVIEVNPVILYFLNKRDLKKGLAIILTFAKQTLEEGKKWSS